MKNKDLIEQLQKFPDDMEVCVYDWRKNIGDDDGSGSSEGIHSEFEVTEHKLEPDEAEFYKEQNDKDFVPWIGISFENFDYDVNGKLVAE